MRNKCNHEFGNPTDGSRWDSAVVAFISQTSSKLGRNSPAAERHLSLARLFKAGRAVTWLFQSPQRRLISAPVSTVAAATENGYALVDPALKTCHYPNLFSFAPEALRRLAGGASHRKARHYCLCAPAGARDRSAILNYSSNSFTSSAPAGARRIGRLDPVAGATG